MSAKHARVGLASSALIVTQRGVFSARKGTLFHMVSVNHAILLQVAKMILVTQMDVLGVKMDIILMKASVFIVQRKYQVVSSVGAVTSVFSVPVVFLPSMMVFANAV